MADATFNCTVLTPERTVLSTAASFASLPAYDGEIGILRDRAPLLCRLNFGIVRLATAAGVKRLYVDAGFAELRDNELTILTELALSAEEIDLEEQKAAQARARKLKARSPQEHETRRREIARATAKIKLAERT